MIKSATFVLSTVVVADDWVGALDWVGDEVCGAMVVVGDEV